MFPLCILTHEFPSQNILKSFKHWDILLLIVKSWLILPTQKFASTLLVVSISWRQSTEEFNKIDFSFNVLGSVLLLALYNSSYLLYIICDLLYYFHYRDKYHKTLLQIMSLLWSSHGLLLYCLILIHALSVFFLYSWFFNFLKQDIIACLFLFTSKQKLT